MVDHPFPCRSEFRNSIGEIISIGGTRVEKDVKMCVRGDGVRDRDKGREFCGEEG